MPAKLTYSTADKSNALPFVNEAASSTNIFNSIKEGIFNTPNDADYIDDGGSNGTYQVNYDSQTSTSNCIYLTLYVRARKNASAGKVRTLSVNLVVNASTVVSISFSDAELAAGWSSKWASAMGNWTKAQVDAGYVEVTSSSSGGGAARKVQVSAVHVLGDTNS